MTGHKVQGLSLYNGVLVHYPTKEESKKMNPMSIWGLNYCILTRVPDISKIAFINLPDYESHMKLFNKISKGKDYFTYFKNFDKKASLEFAKFVKICTGQTLDYLKNAETKLCLSSPIDFSALSSEKKQYTENSFDLSDLHQLQLNEGALQISKSHEFKESNIMQSPKETFNKENSLLTAYDVQNEQNMTNVESTFPRFENKGSSNHCWFNSASQVIIHALKGEPELMESNDFDIENDNDMDVDISVGIVLFKAIQMFTTNSGINDVGTKIKDPSDQNTELPLKYLMLKQMRITAPVELHQQHDVAQCIEAMLPIVPKLSFLMHQTQDQLKCSGPGCEYLHSVTDLIPITSIEISTTGKRLSDGKGKFNGKDAIKKYFQDTEHGIKRNCDACNSNVSSKQIKLYSSCKYIIIQFKRFFVTGNRTRKNNKETEPFSFVDIETLEGIKRYEVVATIEHIGDEMKSGHYISYIKRNNNWFHCNDTKIMPLANDNTSPTKNSYIILLKEAIE